MPSERFFKLSEDKQQRIIEASMDEFIASGMHDASINRIIKDADISRGSFYTYFEDRNDLFNFIFSTLKHSSASIILDEIEKKHGDVFAAARSLVEREFGSLKKIKDNYPKYVISMTPLVTRTDDDGIIHLSLREFLARDDKA